MQTAATAYPVNIGQAAAASGVSAKMIRHYEEIGLVPPAARTQSGYRMYSEADVHTLRFIRRARDLGFSVKQITALLGLWRDRRRASARVKALTREHIALLDQRILEMTEMRRTLAHLAARCHGDERPDCPILEDLTCGAAAPASAARGAPPDLRTANRRAIIQ
ncbi:MAG: Cu(I)-responsive transcriptional regulator [Burkholderiales bacterium]|nr:Cu(I)-responsive transcriptional regulator [Burkholderiales bacterium]